MDFTANPEPSGLTNPDAAAQLRFFQTKDPATNTVPMERLWDANRAAEQSGQQPLSALLLFTVAERGPSSIGGRTRAVLWDPDVSNKVWAGGVSGGLWYTSNITVDGTSWVKVNDFWDNLAVTTMAFDPSTGGASRVFYVGTGEGFFNIDAVRGPGIFKSTDAGASFTLLSSTENSTFNHVQKVVVTSSGTVLAATRSGIQRSTTGGTSWTQVLANGVGSPSAGLTDNAADLEIDADGNIYAGMGLIFGGCDGVYKSTNDGVNWTKQSLPGTCNYGRVEVAVAPSHADTLYVATQADTNPRVVNHIFQSTNGGTSWTDMAEPSAGSQAWYDLILAVDPNNAETVWLGVVTLWRSITGGASWSQISGTGIHVDHHAIAYKPGSSDEIVFGNDGGVYYTANATASAAAKTEAAVPTAIDRNDDYNITQYYGGDIHPASGSNIMIAGTQDNSTHRFSNPGIGPITLPSPLNCCDGGFAYIDQTNPDIMIGSIQNGAYYRSTDSGLSFSGSPFLSAGGLFINPGDYDDTENVFYATRTTTTISRCYTLETSPTCAALTVTGMNDEGSTYTVSPYSAAGTSTVYIGTQNGKLFRVETTLNGSGVPTGETITDLTPGGSVPTSNISSIAIGSSEMQLLITFSNYGVDSVWETLNGGTTWLDRDDNSTLPDMPINWAIYDPNDTQRVLLGTEAGVWGTTDVTAAAAPANAGKTQLALTWVRAPDIPIVSVHQLVYRASDGQIMIITHGRGVWTAQFNDLIGGSATRYVATTGTDAGNGCTNALNPCATVAHAVSQANDGDTLNIAAGTYLEPGLLITKALNVEGAGVIVR